MDRRVRKTREALLAAVIEIAASRGWAAASVNEICDKADIARSTFYLHFSDKSALVDFAISRLQETIKGEKSQDSLTTTGLFSFLEPLVRLAVDPAHAFLFNSDPNTPDHHHISDQFRQMIERLVADEVKQAGAEFDLSWAHQSFVAGGIHSLIHACHKKQVAGKTDQSAKALLALIAPILKRNATWGP